MTEFLQGLFNWAMDRARDILNAFSWAVQKVGEILIALINEIGDWIETIFH